MLGWSEFFSSSIQKFSCQASVNGFTINIYIFKSTLIKGISVVLFLYFIEHNLCNGVQRDCWFASCKMLKIQVLVRGVCFLERVIIAKCESERKEAISCMVLTFLILNSQIACSEAFLDNV